MKAVDYGKMVDDACDAVENGPTIVEQLHQEGRSAVYQMTYEGEKIIVLHHPNGRIEEIDSVKFAQQPDSDKSYPIKRVIKD